MSSDKNERIFERGVRDLVLSQHPHPDWLLCLQAVDGDIHAEQVMRDGATADDEIRMLEDVRDTVTEWIEKLRAGATGPAGDA